MQSNLLFHYPTFLKFSTIFVAWQTVYIMEFSVPDIFETFSPALVEILKSWNFSYYQSQP